MVILLEGCLVLLGFAAKDPLVVADGLLKILERCIAKAPVFISEVIASKVELYHSSSFEFELVLLFEHVDDGLWLSTADEQVVHVDGDILVVIAHVSHPDVGLGFGEEESFVHQDIGKSLMPT